MNKKDFIEAEIIDENGNVKKEDIKINSENREKKFEDPKIKEMKRIFLLKGFKFLAPYLLITIGFIVLLFWIIFLIFSNPFDYIFAGLLAYFLIKVFYKMWKLFKK